MAAPRIHPTAIVDPAATLADDVEIGPYAVIGPEVTIGPGTTVGPHAVVEGRTTLGARNRIFQFAAVGAIPQDLKYRGEPSTLSLGDDNVVREFATLHPGTAGGGMSTTVGNGNLFMNFSHVAHDCHVGDRAIFANGATLAGHVIVGDFVIVGGLAGIHQFARLGEGAMIAAGAMVAQDVPPYCMAQGDRAMLVGLNVEGLRRRGTTPETIRAIRRAYREVVRARGALGETIPRLRAELGDVPEVARFLDFFESAKRGVCRARRRGEDAADEGD